jgi:polyisoprenoid-binding protein YceI
MRNLRIAGLFAAILLVASAAAAQETWEIDPAHSSVQFSVRHMMVSNVHGEFAKFSGRVYVDGKDFTKARVEVSIDATSIDTHNDGRDKDLRSANFFDVAKFPTLEFKSKRIEQASQGDLRLIGDLTMHGVTKEVALEVSGPTPEMKDQRGSTHIGASATAKVNRKDFGILWNSTLDGGGVVVGDEVSISIDLELVKRAPAPPIAKDSR